MIPKPSHLGNEYGAQFTDDSVVDVYHLRPPYPVAVFRQLVTLLAGASRLVLDLGCGTGEIARPLAPMVDVVDAVDQSEMMLHKGRQSPGGSAATIRWIHARAEDAPFHPPYDLVVAGASLHWMEWDVVLPRIARVLAPDGFLAIVELKEEPAAWVEEIAPLLRRFSTNRDFRPYDIVQELEQRNLFEVKGRFRSDSVPLRQSIPDYIESFHARNGFSRDRMTTDAANAFDREMEQVIRRHTSSNRLTLQVRGSVVWGRPVPE